MGRFSITVDDDQEKWLDAEAERRDRSRAYIIRELIDEARAGEEITEPVRGGESATGDLQELVADLEVPGGGRDREQRERALVTMLEYLRDEGAASRSDLEDLARTYDHGYATLNSFWKNCVQPALSSLETVESEGQSGRWRWTP